MEEDGTIGSRRPFGVAICSDSTGSKRRMLPVTTSSAVRSSTLEDDDDVVEAFIVDLLLVIG